MVDGNASTSLPLASFADEFLVNNNTGAGMEGPKRLPMTSAAAQISALVSLADAVMAIVTKTLSTPPVSPVTGARYIVGAAATGAWAGKEKQIATWDAAAWTFIVPTAKSTVKIIDESAFYTWSVADSNWVIMLGDALTFATWSALSAVTGSRLGQRAEVNGDGGTHTDPVVGGTVSNSGTFGWSTSPAGWRRMADGTLAPLASPAFTGNPTAPTPPAGDNDTSIATTAFVVAESAAQVSAVSASVSAEAVDQFSALLDALPSEAFYNFLEGDTLSVVRSSKATYIDASGVLSEAAVDVGVLDHDRLSGASRGLISARGIWKNAATNPNDPSVSPWVASNMTPTLGAATGLDGTSSLIKLQNTGSPAYIRQVISLIGLVLTYEAVLKRGDTDWVMVDVTTTLKTYFNLATGVIGTVAAGCTAKMKDLGGGFYFASISWDHGPNPLSTNVVLGLPVPVAGDNDPTPAGSGYVYMENFCLRFGAEAVDHPLMTPSFNSRVADLPQLANNSVHRGVSIIVRDFDTGARHALSFGAGKLKWPRNVYIEKIAVFAPKVTPPSPSFGSGCILGDSTIAAFGGQNAVSSYLLTAADTTGGATVVSKAVFGHTIAQQEAVWTADANKATYDWIVVQIGLNDLNPAESAATALGRYQALIDSINAGKKVGAKVIVSTMNPCTLRLPALYGANWPTARQKWLDMNAAIMGGGANAVTGVDGRNDDHIDALGDVYGILSSVYDTGDSIHENNAGRSVIASFWRYRLRAMNILSAV